MKRVGSGLTENMLSENLEYIEGVMDTSIIVLTCFQNPLKKFAIEFIENVLMFKRRIIIPITAILGAYHIATRYLKVPRLDVKKILVEMLQTRSPALYPYISIDVAIDSLDLASTYNVESWDGYLISLAKTLGAKIIFTLDKELGKIAGVRIEIPFPQQIVEEYHRYIKSLIKSKLYEYGNTY